MPSGVDSELLVSVVAWRLNPDGTLSLSQSEMVHFVRPSADLLFESAAASRSDRVIAVVLTGTGRDGAMGVMAVKKMGGTVIVQEAKTAEFPGMPEAADLIAQVLAESLRAVVCQQLLVTRASRLCS